MNTERDAFERYFADSRRGRGAAKRPTFARLGDDTYSDDHTQRHWWTWQQARAAKDAEIQTLRAALQWYADGEHFNKADPDAWDTVSGEPQNWWCDEAGTATVEDGSIAKMTLAGELTAAQIQALE